MGFTYKYLQWSNIMNLIDQNIIFVPSIRLAEQQLTNLRMEGFTEDAVDMFKRGFEKFTESLKDFKAEDYIEGMRSIWYYVLRQNPSTYNRNSSKIASRISGFTRSSDSLGYASFASVALPCPDGFKGDFLGYTQALASIADETINNAMSIMDEFRVYMSMVLSNSNAAISIKDNTKRYKNLEQTRSMQEKLIGSWFTPNAVNQRQLFSKMFASSSEIRPAMETSVAVYKKTEAIDLKNFNNRVKELYDRMTGIIAMAESGKTVVSKQTLQNLADGAMEVARQIEHLTKFMVRAEIAITASDNMIVTIDKNS